jgi:hypothetical protein
MLEIVAINFVLFRDLRLSLHSHTTFFMLESLLNGSCNFPLFGFNISLVGPQATGTAPAGLSGPMVVLGVPQPAQGKQNINSVKI